MFEPSCIAALATKTKLSEDSEPSCIAALASKPRPRRSEELLTGIRLLVGPQLVGGQCASKILRVLWMQAS